MIIPQRLFLFVALFLLLIHSPLHAQVGQEIKLSESDSSSFSSLNYARSVAVSGKDVHVVYYGRRVSAWGIFYKRSLDGGNTWQPETPLENGAAQVRFPSVAATGAEVHIVWEDKRGKVLNVYYRRSTDQGQSWRPETQLTNDTTDSVCPVVTVSGTTVHTAWQEFRRGWDLPGIFYRRSPDEGKTWEPAVPLCQDQVFSDHPSFGASGLNVHVVWEWGARREGIFRVGYRHSGDGGKTWDPETFLTSDTMISYSPTIAVSGAMVHLVWEERQLKNYFLHYKKSTDGGKTWGPDTLLAPVSTVEPSPTIAAIGSRVFLAWNDKREGHWAVYVRRSENGGRSWGPEARLTPKTTDASVPSAAFSGSTLHLIWSEERDGTWQVYYERNTTGK